VYHEPVDHTALLFQIGEEDRAAEYVPDYQGAAQRIEAVLHRHELSWEDLQPGA
jgi:hypothetical protein